MITYTFNWFEIEDQGADGKFGMLGGPPEPDGLTDLIERGLRLIERADSLPRVPADVHDGLAAVRRARFPTLPTYGSVDAALADIDRATLVGTEARWNGFRGVREPSPGREWASRGFDDRAWEASVLPVGQGSAEARTALDDMKGRYSSVYLRHRCSVPAPAKWRSLRMTVRHDDGFVAFLNGVEVHRAGAGSAGERLPFDAHASLAIRNQPRETLVHLQVRLLRSGENVIALHGLNSALDDEDFFLDARVEGETEPEAGKDDGLVARCAGRAAGGAFARAERYFEGRILQRRGRHAEATGVFRALRDADPASLEVLCRLVECLRASGGAEEADAILHASLAAEPPFPENDKALLNAAAWGVLRLEDQALEDYYRAARWAERARDLEPPLPVNISRLTVAGVARYRLGLYREALSTLERTYTAYAAVNQGQRSHRDVAFLAMTYHRLGRVEEARQTFLEFRHPERMTAWAGSPFVHEAAAVLGIEL